MGEYKSAVPFTFGMIPSVGKVYKVEDGKVITYSGGGKSVQMDFQPINSSSRMSRSGNSVVLDANCDSKQGPFKETVYQRVINCDAFVAEIQREMQASKSE